MMKLMTKPQEKKLIKNHELVNKSESTVTPVIKLFTPDANATWFLSEYDPELRTFFGLCDLGLGFADLGYVSRDELEALRGRLGLPVERDLHWTPKTFSELMA
jgi:hypothetical protein